MSSAVSFRRPGSLEGPRCEVSRKFLNEPPAHSHAVQFYEDEEFLAETVGAFLSAGLRAGERVVVIATEEHRRAFLERLGQDGSQGYVSGQLTMLDADQTLARFMLDGMPDAALFRNVLARLFGGLPRGPEGAAPRVRAYGEMVDVLWRKGNSAAAIRLEELWNDASQEHPFELLCAYVMGNFYKEGDTERFLEVCRTHTHVLPTEGFIDLEDEHARLREISSLQQRARALEAEVRHRKELEAALRSALAERTRAEQELRAGVEREREARARAESSDQFKDVFVGILGHDLRNPLNTILTTARLMVMRGELPPDNHKRLQRIVSSGTRMERMIDQVLDLTRARLGDGMPVERSEHDLVPVVQKIVEELRVAHPGRSIVVRAPAPCVGSFDSDRMEQVVSNLVGNAVAHGDPGASIDVEVEARADALVLRVHNAGPPIDPAFMPLLFDPFKRGYEQKAGRSAGLGLGLYISERIVTGHRGTIDVESSTESGTTFEVVLPRSP